MKHCSKIMCGAKEMRGAISANSNCENQAPFQDGVIGSPKGSYFSFKTLSAMVHEGFTSGRPMIPRALRCREIQTGGTRIRGGGSARAVGTKVRYEKDSEYHIIMGGDRLLPKWQLFSNFVRRQHSTGE